jgi:hypothetical protein
LDDAYAAPAPQGDGYPFPVPNDGMEAERQDVGSRSENGAGADWRCYPSSIATLTPA